MSVAFVLRCEVPVYFPRWPECETAGGQDWTTVDGVLDALLVADGPIGVQRQAIAALRAVSGPCIAPLEIELRRRGLAP